MEVGDCIVIDAGSASVKAGYSGEDTPRSVFPSILDEGGAEALSGLARSGGRRPESVECHFENAAQHPIQHGLVAEGNWEKMERLWDVTFGRELHQYPEGSSASGGAHGGLSVLLAEAPGTPAAARERAAQIMFETFKVPALCFFNSASLSLFASGRTRGVVLESGAGVSHAVPVFEGFALAHAVLRSELAGQDVTSALAANLRRTGSTLGFNVVRDMKEKLCRVAPLQGRASAALAAAWRAKGDDDRAREYLERCLEHAQVTDDLAAQAAACRTLGALHSARGDFNRAVELLQRNFSIARQLLASGDADTALVDRARVHLGIALGNEALGNYLRALQTDFPALLAWKNGRDALPAAEKEDKGDEDEEDEDEDDEDDEDN